MRAPVEDEERMPARDHLGKKYVSMSAMAKAWGISEHLLITRLGRGWSLKRVLTTPIGEVQPKKVSEEAKAEFLNKADDAIRQCCLAMNRAFGELIIKTFEITDPEKITKVRAYVEGKTETSTAHAKELLIGSENCYDGMPENVIWFLYKEETEE